MRLHIIQLSNLYHFFGTFLQDLRKDRKQNPPQICDFALRGGVPPSHLGESPAFTDPMAFSRRFRSFRHLTVGWMRMEGWRVLDNQSGVHMDRTRKTLEFCLRELKKQTNHGVVERKVGKSSQKR